MIDVIEGHLVLNPAGLTLFIFAVGGLFGLAAAALTWAGLRSYYRPDPQPQQDGKADEAPLTITIPPPVAHPRGVTWPAYRSGYERERRLAVTAIQPRYDDRSMP